MKKKNTLIWFALIGLPCGLWAQNSIKSLEECLRQVSDNNLTLKSRRMAVEKAKDLQGTAFNIDRTYFSMSQDPTSGGSPDNSLSVSQSFEFPTIYSTRHSLLKAETELERNRLNVSENELIREVTSLYYNLLLSKEHIRILQQQDSIYRKFLLLASAKFKAGETNRLEQINAEKLCNENKLALQNAARDFQNKQLLMQNKLNTNEMIEPKEDSLPIIPAAQPTNNWDASQTPQSKVYESQLVASEKNVSLQQQEFIPKFNFSLRNQFLLNGFHPYNIPRERFDEGNFMGFEVGINLPLFFGEQRAKAKAAKKEVEIIRMQQETDLLSIQKEYETALNEYEKAKANLEYYLQTGNRQAEEITKISQLTYEKGEIGYIEYIQNLKIAVDIHLQYAYAVNDYNQTVITLQFLQGIKSIKTKRK
jgi:cobalt-zinc-cadmium resistance protein CzcA